MTAGTSPAAAAAAAARMFDVMPQKIAQYGIVEGQRKTTLVDQGREGRQASLLMERDDGVEMEPKKAYQSRTFPSRGTRRIVKIDY